MDFEPIVNFANFLILALPALITAILGGWVSLFTNGKVIPSSENPIRYMMKRSLVSGFTGIIVFSGLQGTVTSTGLVVSIVGISGFAASEILPYLKSAMLARVKEKIPDQSMKKE